MTVRRIIKGAATAVLLLFFIYLALNERLLESVMRLLFKSESDVIYTRASLGTLILEHLFLVLTSSFLAVISGVAAGLGATRRWGRDFLPMVQGFTALAQTFPPVAVLALAVPFLGFGYRPAIFALFLYSILPVLNNTIGGVLAVDSEVIDAARGMGMTDFQILLKVEVPMSLKLIISGIRTSVVINVGTATVGSLVGAGGLGAPIVSGLIRDNTALIFEGAAAAAVLAIILDRMLYFLESRV